MKTNTESLKKIGLDSLGITTADEIYHNISYDTLYDHETNPDLDGFERGTPTRAGAVSVDTGRFTGRSPKDKYIVEEEGSKDHVWWKGTGSDNQKLSQEKWNALKDITLNRLNGKKLYVMDLFCGANPSTRLSIRLVTEIAWKAHFAKNMFIRPTDEELKDFKPDWTILDACKTSCESWKELGLNSEVFVSFHVAERTTLIGGTWYGGEIKKGIFTMMNYYLPF